MLCLLDPVEVPIHLHERFGDAQHDLYNDNPDHEKIKFAI